MNNVYRTPADDPPDRDQVGRNPATHTDLSAGRPKNYAPNPYWHRPGPALSEPPVPPTPAPATESETGSQPVAVDSPPSSPTPDAPIPDAASPAPVATGVPVSPDTGITLPKPTTDPDTVSEARLRQAWQESLAPIRVQLDQLSQQVARPQPPVSVPEELTKELGRQLTALLPQLPALLRPTLEQGLARAVPKVIRVEQPGRAVLRLVRVLTGCCVVLGLVLGGLLYQVLDLRRQLAQVTPGYWQHRYLQARSTASRNHALRQWLYQADTLYAGNTFAPTLSRLENPVKPQPGTRTKPRSSKQKQPIR